ncbi:TetR/AcrR family transcriptional regulator [Streptomyces sp. NBC_00878]|uniref:TetR/AcrR family transcriptional regulator n=1 Tax=Streptomyces sp. NBC_00878 TaxID=2975854 RepID=UPI0022513C4E|nr:TetR/AcrR family transcriptional regulator [Streptomyces sp. NBC_00878]MCX4905385.1 TetR/AcrR family transcriptional regulator [Streptomyces sp. NBC_00878]
MQVSNRVGPGMSERRRCRIRLMISREASRLFWEQGVAATSGDQIGEAVGLSTRTIWRHFRSKESCAEPIILHGVAWEMAALRRWKPELSLDDHLADEMSRHGRDADRAERADDVLAMKMIALSSREPALRTAWLMACDQVERELAGSIADRLDLPADDIRVQVHAAAASGALRVVNEEIGDALLGGADVRRFAHAHQLLAQAIRSATGGAVGDAATT